MTKGEKKVKKKALNYQWASTCGRFINMEVHLRDRNPVAATLKKKFQRQQPNTDQPCMQRT